jgi:hypothetical protein
MWFLSIVFALLVCDDGLVFADVTDEDRDLYSELSDEYQLAESKLGRFSVLARGERIEIDLEDSSPSSVLSQVAFRLSKSNSKERWTYFSQPLLIDDGVVEDLSVESKTHLGFESDLLRLSELEGFQFVNNSIIKLIPGDFEDTFRRTIAFHPFMGAFIQGPRLGSISTFRGKVFGVSRLKKIAYGKDGGIAVLLEVPGPITIYRQINFKNRLPVKRMDSWRNPKLEVISETRVRWGSKNDRVYPVEIDLKDGQFDSKSEIHFVLDWKFDDKVHDRFFDRDNLGKADFEP